MNKPVSLSMSSSPHDSLSVVQSAGVAATAPRAESTGHGAEVASTSETAIDSTDASAAAHAHEKQPRSPRPSDPMIVFAYDCLRREFDALLARQPAGGDAPAPVDVHQMRIATRRLRVALRLFRRMLPREAKSLRKDFGRFARALGEVRDLDVYTDNFREYAQAVPPEKVDELGGYELHLRRERAEARSRLAALFAEGRHAALLGAFSEFLKDAPAPAAVRRWRSFKVADGVEKYLAKSLKRVLKLGHKVGDDARAKDLHRLRIRTKRFRYELEFFVAAYPSLAKAAKATKALQDLLGIHQDACIATERLAAYARGLRKRGRGATPAALGTLIDSQDRQARDVRARFGAEWRTFESTVARGKLAT
jgi:CHAD domain-containing protein